MTPLFANKLFYWSFFDFSWLDWQREDEENLKLKRNLERFPVDLMFQLTTEEWLNLISQNAISRNHGTMLNSTMLTKIFCVLVQPYKATTSPLFNQQGN
jgi:hypothetical protein